MSIRRIRLFRRNVKVQPQKAERRKEGLRTRHGFGELKWPGRSVTSTSTSMKKFAKS